MNKVILTGRLTRDPETRYTETRYTQNETAVATFTLAVDRRRTNDNQPSADFIPCVFWGKMAEVAGNHLAKGRKILVEGRIQVRNYEAKDGTKRYVTEVIGESFEFLEKKSDGKNQSEFGETVPDEEIPF